MTPERMKQAADILRLNKSNEAAAGLADELEVAAGARMYPACGMRKSVQMCRAAITSMMALGEHRRDVLQIGCHVVCPSVVLSDILDAIEGLFLGFIIEKDRDSLLWHKGFTSCQAHNKAASERLIAGVKWNESEIHDWIEESAGRLDSLRETLSGLPNPDAGPRP